MFVSYKSGVISSKFFCPSFQWKSSLKDDEEIKLSPSSIGNYQCCPQKFYFANLLNLKTSGTFAANYGTIVHAVFEVFNKTGLSDYTKEHIINLADILFNSKVDPNRAIDCGFEQLKD